MKIIKQISKFLFVVGLAIMLMSLLFPGGFGSASLLAPGNCGGEVFLVTDDVFIFTATREGNQTYSLFFLESDDVLQVLESGNMTGIEPLHALEDIMEYQGWIHFPKPGTYGLIATHSHNETIVVWVQGLAFPRFSFIFAGLILSLPMLLIAVGNFIRVKWLKRKEM